MDKLFLKTAILCIASNIPVSEQERLQVVNLLKSFPKFRYSFALGLSNNIKKFYLQSNGSRFEEALIEFKTSVSKDMSAVEMNKIAHFVCQKHKVNLQTKSQFLTKEALF